MSEIDYGKAEQIVLEYAGGRGLPEDEMDWMDIVWKLWCELESLRPPGLPPLGVKVSEKIAAKERLGGG